MFSFSSFADQKTKKKWKKPAPKKDIVGRVWINRPSTSVGLPKTYKLPASLGRKITTKDYQLRLYSRTFSRGELVYVEVIKRNKKATEPLNLKYEDVSVPLASASFGHRGFFAIPAEIKKRVTSITFQNVHYQLPIRLARFQTSRRRINLGSFSNTSKPMSEETQKFIWDCVRKKKAAFESWTSDQMSNKVSHPRDMHKITSPFMVTRIVDRYKIEKKKKVFLKPRVQTHRGLDLRGTWGTPIYAMADGTVVLAEKMYFEGNFTVIDHGNGIFTSYMHQSKINVYPGQKVKGGDIIGEVGDTGMARGAHLHVELRVRGVPVDPLTLLALPVRL